MITAKEHYDAEMQRFVARAGGCIPTDADAFEKVALAAIRSAVATERERYVMIARRKLGDILRDES